jgi:peptidoglycan L-alanyl-D-glutamate endopeptidase CwlK
MASRKLTDLEPETYRLAEAFVCALDAAKIPYVVACTLRTSQEQTALYAQGRQPLPVVNTLRHDAELPPIGEEENKKAVTWAAPGKSLHEKGMALDVYPIDGGKLAADNSPLWCQIGAIGEGCGLEWGGKWAARRKDLPHFQKRRSV